MIRFFADSTSDLSKELIERYNITIVPLYINIDDTYYKDGVEITRDRIFEWSDATEKTPKTAAPSIEDVIKCFEPYKDSGDELFYFAISEDMSSSANVARLAAEELQISDNVFVVDSQSLSTGISLLLIKAVEMADEGIPASVIFNRILDMRSRVRASFVVDTLTYLGRGGRCKAATALIGNALKLKPRIEVIDGKMEATAKYRGSNDRVIKKYVEDLKDNIQRADKSRVFITHTVTDGDSVSRVKAFLEAQDIFSEILITDAGGVIASHCGPGTLGVLYIEE